MPICSIEKSKEQDSISGAHIQSLEKQVKILKQEKDRCTKVDFKVALLSKIKT